MTAAERLAFAFLADHPEDAARLLERADPADAAAMLGSVPAAAGADAFRALGPSPAAACAAALRDDALAGIIAALPLDVAGAAIRGIEPSRRDAVLAFLEEERRAQLRAVLAYPEDTAGWLADPLVLALPADMTLADAQRQLRGARAHLFPYLYVVARDRVLLGAVAMPELMAGRPRDTLTEAMHRDLVRLDAHADLATVAAHPAWRDFDALPVVDTAGRLIGAIRHRSMRRRSAQRDRPVMATLVGLSELYWAGLSGILASLAPGQGRAEEDTHVT